MCTRRFTFILDFTERSDAAVAAMPLGRAEAAGGCRGAGSDRFVMRRMQMRYMNGAIQTVHYL